jgi:hypothetical protein
MKGHSVRAAAVISLILRHAENLSRRVAMDDISTMMLLPTVVNRERSEVPNIATVGMPLPARRRRPWQRRYCHYSCPMWLPSYTCMHGQYRKYCARAERSESEPDETFCAFSQPPHGPHHIAGGASRHIRLIVCSRFTHSGCQRTPPGGSARASWREHLASHQLSGNLLRRQMQSGKAEEAFRTPPERPGGRSVWPTIFPL